MHIWKLIFCLLVGLLIESPLMSADFHEKKIGVEIETSWIKIDDRAVTSFSFFTDETKLWLLEPDTSDASGLGSNLELKTYLGFGDQGTFLPIVDMMTHVLREIYSFNTNDLSVHVLEQFLPKHHEKKYHIEEKKSIGMGIISRGEGHIRPQITYQLPLSMIPELFKRLADLGHMRIYRFFNALNNEHFQRPAYPFYSKDKSTLDIYKNNLLIYLLGKKFHKQLNSKEIYKNVKGMTYLFLYYWSSLFNDNEPSSDEPGLKPYLAIMSRIPLSELYAHGLTDEEKEKFKKLVGNVVNELKDGDVPEQLSNNKLKVYKNEKMDIMPSNLTLKQWYYSITDPKVYGKNTQKKLDYEKWDECHVDLLSPPLHLDKSYAMGLFLWDFTKSPLVEVRGYANMVKQAENFSDYVENVKKLINEETSWFFDKK